MTNTDRETTEDGTRSEDMRGEHHLRSKGGKQDFLKIGRDLHIVSDNHDNLLVPLEAPDVEIISDTGSSNMANRLIPPTSSAGSSSGGDLKSSYHTCRDRFTNHRSLSVADMNEIRIVLAEEAKLQKAKLLSNTELLPQREEEKVQMKPYMLKEF